MVTSARRHLRTTLLLPSVSAGSDSTAGDCIYAHPFSSGTPEKSSEDSLIRFKALALQPLDETPNTLKVHSLALVMEVVVCIVHLGIVEHFDSALERLLDGLFVALLVDQVDDVHVSVGPNLLFEVSLRRVGLHARAGKNQSAV